MAAIPFHKVIMCSKSKHITRF